MVDRVQGRKPKDQDADDEDKPATREPRPSDRQSDSVVDTSKPDRRQIEDDEEDDEKDPGADIAERDPGDTDSDDTLTAEQLEEKRARRRQEKKDRRDRDRQEKEELKRTVRELRDELGTVKHHIQNADRDGRLVRLDDDIDETKSVINRLRQLKRQAIEAVDPDRIEDIDDKLYKARRRLEDLEGTKTQASRRTPERAVDPNLIRHANNFMRDHSWYDTRANTDDEDSARVQAIDRRIMREGRFAPDSAEYWDELRNRVKKQLPHRFGRRVARDPDADEGDEDQPRRGSPPVGGRSERGTGPGSGFVLTEDHKSALREAGIEPGTKRYTNMIDKFKQADKEQRAKRREAA